MVEQLLQASAFVANRSPVLRAEEVQAGGVVGNLVDNAGKHAPPGTPVHVEVTRPRGLTRIEVADRGEGVAEIDRERIFAPFTQLDASTTRRVGGVGLGLFLVDRLVRGMGGRVWVEDNEGGGARFVVELPDQAPV